jgi:hypothetical protein
MTHHLDFDQLNDLIDGRVAAGARSAIEAHLAVCFECSEQHRRLVALLTQARELPEELQPPADLWTGVREHIAPTRRPVKPWQWQLVAALLLIAVTSAVTAWLVRRPVIVVRQSAPAAVPVAAVSLSGPARTVDADYSAIVHELTETLAQRRRQLSPETVAKVEASLRVIDIAIDEARAALAADPADRTLLDILAATYQQKVELLRRANELLSTT